jgi:glycosyltransferase involved in cell wall biosynthesis
MQGQRFLEKLRRMAARLRRTRIVFPGYVTGERKAAFFALADLYVFPSRHESYGLTLLEALASGLPAVCLDHYGARGILRDDFGELVQPKELRPAIARLLADDARRKRMSEAARTFAQDEGFSDRAAALAQILKS